MIQNNNFSVLPFYDKLERQHKNKPYAFGAIYPLITPADKLLPFQVMREHREETITGVNMREEYYHNRYNGYYLNEDGLQQAEVGFDVLAFCFPELNAYSAHINVYNANRAYADAVIAIAEDADGNRAFLSVPDDYNDTWVLPKNTKYLYVQIKAVGSEGEVLGTIKNVVLVKSISLYNKDHAFIHNVTSQMLKAGLRVIKSENSEHDIIMFPAESDIDLSLSSGVYYMLMSDGIQTWYSEMFCIVQDINSYLKIEWWDNNNLVFDSGEIIYKHVVNTITGETAEYRNVIYLDTDIGKPDYKFEEDGKERDGYFFAEKQLSEKVYRFTFVAPEYLCDAIRFIRLSDNVQIYKNGIDYIVDSFLADVAWQEQGDLAAVDVEFRTNTVVKKIAAAWPK